MDGKQLHKLCVLAGFVFLVLVTGGMDGPKTTLTGAPELVGGEDVDFENGMLQWVLHYI